MQHLISLLGNKKHERMKHIIILGDGMADHAVERLGGKTLLQFADTPYMLSLIHI